MTTAGPTILNPSDRYLREQGTTLPTFYLKK
jgi:hypothetical protein